MQNRDYIVFPGKKTHTSQQIFLIAIQIFQQKKKKKKLNKCKGPLDFKVRQHLHINWRWKLPGGAGRESVHGAGSSSRSGNNQGFQQVSGDFY